MRTIEVQIQELRLRIAEHEKVIQSLQQRRFELTLPPTIPAGATGSELAEIFESRSGFDNEVLGLDAAVRELSVRLAQLFGELANSTAELRRLREQDYDSQLTSEILTQII